MEEDKVFTGYIYKITCIKTKKVYIGQTIKTVKHRWNQHVNESLRDNHLPNKFHNAIRRYGKDSFKVVTLADECASTIEELYMKLDILEDKYIQQYNSVKKGYNSLPGGRCHGGYVLRKSKFKINQYDLLGNYIATWNSTGEIDSYFKVSTFSKVSAKILDPECHVTWHNYVWRKYNGSVDNIEFDDRWLRKSGYKNCPILQYDLDGNLIREFSQFKEIQLRFPHVNRSVVYDCIKGKLNTAYGFVWRKRNI